MEQLSLVSERLLWLQLANSTVGILLDNRIPSTAKPSAAVYIHLTSRQLQSAPKHTAIL
jgi:hypothetical protein